MYSGDSGEVGLGVACGLWVREGKVKTVLKSVEASRRSPVVPVETASSALFDVVRRVFGEVGLGRAGAGEGGATDGSGVGNRQGRATWGLGWGGRGPPVSRDARRV